MQAVEMPTLNHLTDALMQADADCTGAELHGVMSGLLVAGARLNKQALVKSLESHSDAQSAFTEPFISMLWQLQLKTLEDLGADELDFRPLLPADDAPLTDRVTALGDFCRGLLAGIGLGAPANSTVLAQEEMRETLQDLSYIAQVDSVDDDDEEGEQAFIELYEFVRLASTHLFEELAPAEEHVSDDHTQPTVH